MFLDDDVVQGEKVLKSSYIPHSIWHREEEIKALVSYFKAIITSSATSSTNVILYGPPGTGKTAIVNAFGKDLTKYLKRNQNPGDPVFHSIHINCRRTKSPHKIMTTIINHFASSCKYFAFCFFHCHI